MSVENTPPFAELHAGITAKDLREVISKSGYPFQATVADIIRSASVANVRDFKMQEEWAFIDRESGQARSIDILVDLAFPHDYDNPDSKLRTRLNLLVECKQSDLPYIFFLRKSAPVPHNEFPEIYGLDKQDIRVFTNAAKEEGVKDDSFSWWVNLRDALEFAEVPFFGAPTLYAISFAKAIRRGPKLELTGEDAYRSLTLPLLKAADHLKELSKPTGDHPLLFPRIVINLAVVRAPMICAFESGGENELIALPWVRVSHLEPTEGGKSGRDLSGAVRYFDVVHESFLARYLEVLYRDADEVAQRMHRHSKEVAGGVAFSDLSEGHESLSPLPDHYRQYLSKPCTIIFRHHVQSLGLTVGKSGGEISDHPDNPTVIGWIDGYDWLYPSEQQPPKTEVR
ncbi:hypothetical protein ACH40D_10840 [Streptomyces olivaceoviridis]|uniref:Uncharacterized protein n=1 Tax=Streptomyces olivaceoviridis TaxID=1921 RepID=A0ABW7V9P8_STROI|nr:hypothetical protein [Streptomyces corchorusii]